MTSDAAATRLDEAAHRRGLGHMAVATLTLVILATATYWLPPLSVPGPGAARLTIDPGRLRPWVAGEGIPVVRMFGAGVAELPHFAEAGGQALPAPPADLGTAVASSLREDPDGPDDAGDGAGPAPVRGPALRIGTSEYEGITQFVENAGVLERFYTALERTAKREAGAVVRVAHYGDSSIAADFITYTARRRLQKRFGDAGHGFVLIARGNMFYGHRDIRHKASDGWEVLSLVRNALGKGWYGYGGVQARGTAGQVATFSTVEDAPVGRKVSSFELFFQRYPQGGKIRFTLDGEVHGELDTSGKTREDAWHRIEVPDGPHTLSLRTMGGGRSRLYGMSLERGGPGVVYDSLGLVGARAQRLLNSDPAHMKRQLAHRKANLLVLGFGGNEAVNAWLNLDNYEGELKDVVRHMRSADPELPCLLFGPLDQGHRTERGQIETIPILPGIVDVQRRVALAEGCAFFDTFQAMGGMHSVNKWYRSKPRLLTSDLQHATPLGYRVIGDLYYKALLKAFADHLAGG